MSDEQIFHVEGMTCGGCEKAVANAALSIPGVIRADADRTKNQLTVQWKEGLDETARMQSAKALCKAIDAAGFNSTNGLA